MWKITLFYIITFKTHILFFFPQQWIFDCIIDPCVPLQEKRAIRLLANSLLQSIGLGASWAMMINIVIIECQ